MDHKDFFAEFGDRSLPNDPGNWMESFTTEQLYQAIKQRLIEEVVVIGSDLKITRLIDTTSEEVKQTALGALEKLELIDTADRKDSTPESALGEG